MDIDAVSTVTSEVQDNPQRHRKVWCWITYAIITACVVVACWEPVFGRTPDSENMKELLAPSSIAIWAGAYWALVSTAFVHVDFLHLLMNMYWLRAFGELLEPRFGHGRFASFSMAAAILSAGAELALNDQPGVGYSGVVYAYFGYVFAGRKEDSAYAAFLTRGRTGLFFGWLILCVALTFAKVSTIANAAHFSGLAFGLLAGMLKWQRKYLVPVRTGLALLTLTSVASVLYMPWSSVWRDRGAFAPYLGAAKRAKSGDPDAQYVYGTWCLQMRGRESDGEFWLKKAADQGHLKAMNNLAWRWATDAKDSVRRGKDALDLALKLCGQDSWKSPMFIDTLAACYAEMEQWPEAVETEKMALSKVTDEERSTEEVYRESLRKYYRREKQRVTTP